MLSTIRSWKATWNTKGFTGVWTRFWMRYAGLDRSGRLANRLASWLAPGYKDCRYLATLSPNGYVAPGATIQHSALHLGSNVFIDERVVIFQHENGGPVGLGDGVHLYRDIIIETGPGGSLEIGAGTHIQPRCQFTAFAASIRIGPGVQIAPNCAFYPYDHGFLPGQPIHLQPLQTKGGIVVDEGAWLGFGVVVLSGVRIGRGAVVGAGSVVKSDIPDGAIAAGLPARVIRMRSDLAPKVKTNC